MNLTAAAARLIGKCETCGELSVDLGDGRVTPMHNATCSLLKAAQKDDVADAAYLARHGLTARVRQLSSTERALCRKHGLAEAKDAAAVVVELIDDRVRRTVVDGYGKPALVFAGIHADIHGIEFVEPVAA